MDGVQLNTTAVAPRVDARHGTAAKSDAVVVTTNNDNLVALLGRAFQAVAFRTIAYAACQHNNLVVTVLLAVLLVLKGEHRACDERLTELIAEVAGAVRGFDEDLFGCLVEPGAGSHSLGIGEGLRI